MYVFTNAEVFFCLFTRVNHLPVFAFHLSGENVYIYWSII